MTFVGACLGTLLAASLTLMACGDSEKTQLLIPTSSATPDTTPTPPPTFEGSGTLGSAGGTIVLTGVGRVHFPPGSLRDGTFVSVYQAPTPNSDGDFSGATALFGISDYLSSSLFVQLSGHQPLGHISVELTIPESFKVSDTASTQIIVVGSAVNTSDYEGPIETWDTPAAVPGTSANVTFTASPLYFSRTGAQGPTAIFFLGKTPTYH